MRVAAYKAGARVPINGVTNPGSVVLEVVLDDDRTVQIVVDKDGEIGLRGWGNVPARVGNGNKLEFRAVLQREEATHCERCYCPLDGTPRARCSCG